MKVFVNHRPCELPAGATLAQAVDASQLTPPFAAALNRQFVPKTQYDQTLLQEGDQIELIAPVVGG